MVKFSVSFQRGSVKRACFLAQTAMTISYVRQHKHLKIIIQFLPMRLSY